MQFDESLAARLVGSDGSPTLRVYGWSPPAISVGYNQSTDDFDLAKLHAAGIDIIRRPTGGRAILHVHELTYSVTMRIEGRSLHEIYRQINVALLEGLHYLGIDAQLSQQNSNFRQMAKEPSFVLCFFTSAKHEIQFSGQKLIGSAQRRYGDVVLQHGSLLLGPQHRRLVEFLSSKSREAIEVSVDEHATDVETILKRSISFDETAGAVKKGFEATFEMKFLEEPADELEHIVI
jgi:lipoate-protein ligase A